MLVTGSERAAFAAFAAIPATASTPATPAATAISRAIAILASTVTIRAVAILTVAVHRLIIVAGIGHLVDISGVLDVFTLARLGVARLVDLLREVWLFVLVQGRRVGCGLRQ